MKPSALGNAKCPQNAGGFFEHKVSTEMNFHDEYVVALLSHLEEIPMISSF
jgi:hypothetical protein